MDTRTARRAGSATAVALALGATGAAVAGAGDPPPFREGDPPALLSAHAAGYPAGIREAVGARPRARLRGAVLRLRGGADRGEALVFTRQLGITGTYDSGTGVLTLTGRASTRNYLRALGSVWYDTGDAPSPTRVVAVRVRDDRRRWRRAGSYRLEVTPVNDPPQLGPPSGATRYQLGSGAQPVAPGLAVLDIDSRIARATVQISENFSSVENELVFENRAGITGTYNDGTGVLTLTGASSAARYQEALRSVQYVNNSTDPASPARKITFQVTDTLGAASGHGIWNEPNHSG